MRVHPVRVALLAILLIALPGSSVPAQEAYPSRPVEVVVPFTAGGGTDLLARLLCEGLGRRLGQSFVVLNRPGANSNVGIHSVVRSRPDGHTLIMASLGLAANPSLYRKLPFDPLSDLAPITLIANSPTILVVAPPVAANSLAEFIALVKAQPGRLNYASYGAGSGPHLAAELFRFTTGTDIVHVPFSGGGTAAVGVMSNSVQMLFSSILPVLGQVRSGALKAIAIASDRRSPLLPAVPTFAESGIDYRTGTWFGLLAPARTPDDILSRLNRSAVETLQDAEVRAKITEQGGEVLASSPEDFRAFLRQETERLSVVIRNANIQVD